MSTNKVSSRNCMLVAGGLLGSNNWMHGQHVYGNRVKTLQFVDTLTSLCLLGMVSCTIASGIQVVDT